MKISNVHRPNAFLGYTERRNLTMSLKTQEQIGKLIAEAFSNTQHPSETQLVKTDSMGFHELAYHILRGKTWHQIRFEELWQLRGLLVFLSSEAYAYYIPAIMTGILEHMLEIGLLPRFVYQLTKSSYDGNPDLQNWHCGVVDNLTSQQKAVILDFFRYMRQHYPDMEEELDVAIPYWEELVR